MYVNHIKSVLQYTVIQILPDLNMIILQHFFLLLQFYLESWVENVFPSNCNDKVKHCLRVHALIREFVG